MDETDTAATNCQTDSSMEGDKCLRENVTVNGDDLKEDGPKANAGETASSEAVVSGEKKEDTKTAEEELPGMDSRPAAVCRYRWAKTVPTSSAEVIFFSSNKPNEPVVLSWNDAQAVFYSVEMQVPSGDFYGNLVVEGATYPVEDHNVRPYTFEVDVYIKDVSQTGVNVYIDYI